MSKEFNDALAEARRTLKYSLRYSIPKIADTNQTTFSAMSEIRKSLYPLAVTLLGEDGPRFFKNNWRLTEYGLSKLDWFSNFDKTWEQMLFSDALVFAYTLVREAIAAESSMSGYALYALSKYEDGEKKTGADYLYRKGFVFIDKVPQADTKEYFELFKESDSKNRGEWVKSNAKAKTQNALQAGSSNYAKGIKLLDDYFQKLVNYSAVGKAGHFPLDLYNLFSAQKSVNGSIASMYENEKSELFGKKEVTDYQNGCKRVLQRYRDGAYSCADKLYLYNMIERVFNIDAIDCLYQNILKTDQRTNRRYYLANYLSAFSSIFTLPNSFSRNFIIQMAFDSIENPTENNKHTGGETNFFIRTKKELDGGGQDVAIRGHGESYFDIKEWIEQFNQMAQYLSDFAFPMYETAFMLVLSNYSRSKRTSVSLSDLYSMLSDYLNDENIYNMITAGIDVPEWNIDVIKPSNNKIEDPLLYASCIQQSNILKRPIKLLDLDYIDSLIPNNKMNTMRRFILASSGN